MNFLKFTLVARNTPFYITMECIHLWKFINPQRQDSAQNVHFAIIIWCKARIIPNWYKLIFCIHRIFSKCVSCEINFLPDLNLGSSTVKSVFDLHQTLYINYAILFCQKHYYIAFFLNIYLGLTRFLNFCYMSHRIPDKDIILIRPKNYQHNTPYHTKLNRTFTTIAPVTFTWWVKVEI